MYYSRSGNTEAMARSVAEGAKEAVGAPDEEAKKRCVELGRRVAALASRLA